MIHIHFCRNCYNLICSKSLPYSRVLLFAAGLGYYIGFGCLIDRGLGSLGCSELVGFLFWVRFLDWVGVFNWQLARLGLLFFFKDSIKIENICQNRFSECESQRTLKNCFWNNFSKQKKKVLKSHDWKHNLNPH